MARHDWPRQKVTVDGLDRRTAPGLSAYRPPRQIVRLPALCPNAFAVGLSEGVKLRRTAELAGRAWDFGFELAKLKVDGHRR